MHEPRPPQPLGLAPSFGFGDRLGLATPGHLDALRSHGAGIHPIFAQQSIREMERTRRSPSDVVDDALVALRAGNYTGPWGADADHLKSQEDVKDSSANKLPETKWFRPTICRHCETQFGNLFADES